MSDQDRSGGRPDRRKTGRRCRAAPGPDCRRARPGRAGRAPVDCQPPGRIEPQQALQQRLGDLVVECAATGGPPVELIARSAPVVLAPDAMSQVLRVVQEALHNARRHASAEHIVLRLDREALATGSRWRITAVDLFWRMRRSMAKGISASASCRRARPGWAGISRLNHEPGHGTPGDPHLARRGRNEWRTCKMDTIRVLLADDHALFREGLASIIAASRIWSSWARLTMVWKRW